MDVPERGTDGAQRPCPREVQSYTPLPQAPEPLPARGTWRVEHRHWG